MGIRNAIDSKKNAAVLSDSGVSLFWDIPAKTGILRYFLLIPPNAAEDRKTSRHVLGVIQALRLWIWEATGNFGTVYSCERWEAGTTPV